MSLPQAPNQMPILSLDSGFSERFNFRKSKSKVMNKYSIIKIFINIVAISTVN